MSELTIEQLIKIILGVLVIVAVLIVLYIFFKNQVIDFFKGFGGGVPQISLALIKSK